MSISDFFYTFFSFGNCNLFFLKIRSDFFSKKYYRNRTYIPNCLKKTPSFFFQYPSKWLIVCIKVRIPKKCVFLVLVLNIPRTMKNIVLITIVMGTRLRTNVLMIVFPINKKCIGQYAYISILKTIPIF